MDITSGNEYDFLGMEIKINTDKTVSIYIGVQSSKVIKEFENFDTVDSNTVTPAANYLFTVNPSAEELDQKYSEPFHTITAKLGYIMKQARPDIETIVYFLMKRAAKSDTND